MSNIDPNETFRIEDHEEDIPAKPTTEENNQKVPLSDVDKERGFKEGTADNSNTDKNEPQQK